MDWLQSPPWNAWSKNCIIYNKGDTAVPSDQLPDNACVISLTNVGRDMHTFLYHAYLHYGNEHDEASCTLADVTMFLPGSMTDKRKTDMGKPFCMTLPSVILAGPVDKVVSMTDSLRSETFMLDSYKTSNDQNRAKEPGGGLSAARIRPFGKWFSNIFTGEFALENTAPLGWCGIQSVSKKSIRQRPKALLLNLLQELNGGPAPEEVHYVERVMTALFRPVGPPRIVWLLWLQGWHEAPPLVLHVRDSWRYHNQTWDIRCIDASHPIVSRCKWNDAMQHAAWSDAVRLQLLTTYGGVWADATMACLQPLDTWVSDLDLANSKSGMWMYHGLPNQNIVRTPASWFMLARPYTYVFCKWLAAAAEFWRNHNSKSIEYPYFWLDDCFNVLYVKDELFQKAWDATAPKLPANKDGGYGLHGWFIDPANTPAAQRANPSRVIKLTHKPSPYTQAMIALVKEHMVLGGLPVKPDTQEMLTTPETIASAPDKRKMSVTVVYITIAVIAIAALAAGLIYFGIHKAAQKSKKNAR